MTSLPQSAYERQALESIWEWIVRSGASGGGNRRWQRDVVLRHRRAQAVRIVRDNAGNPHLEHAFHIGALVDGPGDDLEPERLCFRKRRRSHVAIVGRPDRAAGCDHQPRRRTGKIVDVQPGRPWRWPRLAALQGIAVAAIAGQADALDLWRNATQDRK